MDDATGRGNQLSRSPRKRQHVSPQSNSPTSPEVAASSAPKGLSLMNQTKTAGVKPASSVIAAKETTMNRRTVVAALCATATWAPARAQPVGTSVVRMPQDIVFKGLPGAPQHVTLFGDSSQPGLFVDRIRFLPGMKVMPHWHPDTVRTVLVMSGTFYFAIGEQWDESKLKAYPAGTLYSEPPRTPHYAWAKDGEVILQITAIGPTGNVPVALKKP